LLSSRIIKPGHTFRSFLRVSSTWPDNSYVSFRIIKTGSQHLVPFSRIIKPGHTFPSFLLVSSILAHISFLSSRIINPGQTFRPFLLVSSNLADISVLSCDHQTWHIFPAFILVSSILAHISAFLLGSSKPGTYFGLSSRIIKLAHIRPYFSGSKLGPIWAFSRSNLGQNLALFRIHQKLGANFGALYRSIKIGGQLGAIMI